MSPKTELPRKLMLAVALLQGLVLYALYKCVELEYWPSQNPQWLVPLFTVAIVTPLLFLLAVHSHTIGRTAQLTLGFSLVLLLCAIYIGAQAEPFGAFPWDSLIGIYILCAGIAAFKGLMYLQPCANREPLTYTTLFSNSWRNFLVVYLATLLVWVFSGILQLCASLFAVIGIEWFKRLFARDWFLFPALSVAGGLGIIIFRELTQVIDNITRLLQGLIKLLWPLLLAIALGFLIALPFTGLELLWATGSGTALLLWLTALILFFANAVYQDGRGEAPYPMAIHRGLSFCLLVLPFLCALSGYGLWLRLDQYGWSVARYWAFVVWGVFTLFSAGYGWGVITQGSAWTTTLASVNRLMGLVVLAIAVLANTPLLDFRKLSLQSQLSRLEAGEVSPQGFDYYYVHRELARPGYLELERMKVDIGDADPELLEKITNPQPHQWAPSTDQLERFWSNAEYRPTPFNLPPALKPLIEQSFAEQEEPNKTIILHVDLNNDEQLEYLVLPIHAYFYGGQYFWLDENGIWQGGYLQGEQGTLENATEALENGVIELIDPKFKSIKIGELILHPK